MRRAILAAVVFSFFSAASYAAEPVFEVNDGGAIKIVKLIRWVAKIDDLAGASDTLPRALGLPASNEVYFADINGKKVKDWTSVLRNAPVWPGAKSTLDYTVFEPDGPAGSWRADIAFYLEPSEVCIHLQDLEAALGAPTATGLVTDGGGATHGWQLRQAPWRTVLWGYFGRLETGCDSHLKLIEYPANAPYPPF